MQMKEFFVAQLEREIAPTRRTLAQVPEGKNDWRPHPKSMPLGYLSILVASMVSWISMIVDQDEHDIRPPGGRSSFTQTAQDSTAALLRMLDDSAAQARKSLSGTTDDRLGKTWRMLAGGQLVIEQPRHVAITDGFSHLAHHRGQLTVYLRLNDALVPSIYGPSADDNPWVK
jgi:uncharacterized damage-inducible protein DinB